MIWNHNFFFATNEEKETIFNPNSKSALFVEFYPFENILDKRWKLKLFGWSRLKLDNKRKQILLNDEFGFGFKTDLKFHQLNDSLIDNIPGRKVCIVSAIRLTKENEVELFTILKCYFFNFLIFNNSNLYML